MRAVFFFLQLPALGFLSAADEIGAHTVLTAAEPSQPAACAATSTCAWYIIILQDESRLIVELLRWDLFQIAPART